MLLKLNDKMDGLQNLLILLTCVNDKGWDCGFREGVLGEQDHRCVDPILYPESLPLSGNTHSYSEPLLSLRRALDDCKKLMGALTSAKQYLGKEIRTLRRRCAPLMLEDGLNQLPNELLAHIFEIAHETEICCEFSRTVSYVSRRFRQVSLGSPRLWTKQSAYDHHELTRTYASRSRHHELEVSDARHESIPIKPFLEILGPFSRRWSILDIHFDDPINMMRSLEITNFPRLRHITFGPYCSSEASLSSWNISSVSRIEAPFTLLHWVPLQSRLTCIMLHLNLQVSRTVDVGVLSRALISLKALRDLSLTISNCRWETITETQTPQPLSVNIDTLTISLETSPNPSLVEAIYDALSFFTATDAAVHLSMDSPFREGYFLNSQKEFFPQGSTIRIYAPQDCGVSNVFWQVTKHSKKIAHAVHLDLPSADAGYKLYMSDFMCNSPVRQLHLQNCDSLVESDIELLANKLLSTEEQKGL
ncbi:hypothetical protein BD410DRAFT_307072 [Rickenella mellea]|uniref:F-box domain-containing protein n=1 Tax=Rickenella mellea TaxID=50990 RepID=A0A4Y7Q1X4_9AGAM|nr:hypothetical protein BD410DRAFT_307072 [Rickenella mellea]